MSEVPLYPLPLDGLYFEPCLDASSSRSDVKSSIQTLNFPVGAHDLFDIISSMRVHDLFDIIS